jgi:hypothetical protein
METEPKEHPSYASPRLDGACNQRRGKFGVSTGPLVAESAVVLNIADQADAIFVKMSPDEAEAMGNALVAQARAARGETAPGQELCGKFLFCNYHPHTVRGDCKNCRRCALPKGHPAADKWLPSGTVQ